jgi:hypothetical protein
MQASCVLFKECVVGSITCLQLQLYAALQQEGQQSEIAWTAENPSDTVFCGKKWGGGAAHESPCLSAPTSQMRALCAQTTLSLLHHKLASKDTHDSCCFKVSATWAITPAPS